MRVAPPGSKLPHLLLLLLTGGTLDLPFRLPVSSLPRLHSCPSFQHPFLSSLPTQPVASDLSVSLSSITISISPLTLPLHPPRIRPRTLFRDIIRGSRCSCILIFLSTQSRKSACLPSSTKAVQSPSIRLVASRPLPPIPPLLPPASRFCVEPRQYRQAVFPNLTSAHRLLRRGYQTSAPGQHLPQHARPKHGGRRSEEKV